MSLDKAVEYKKEKRSPYIGSKEVDRSCRNHGSCIWCLLNRKYKNIKREEEIRQKKKEWETDEYN